MDKNSQSGFGLLSTQIDALLKSPRHATLKQPVI